MWGKTLCCVPVSPHEVPQVGWQHCHPTLLLKGRKKGFGYLQPFTTQVRYVASLGFANTAISKRAKFCEAG